MADDSSRMDRMVETLVERLLRTGIDGAGPLDSAQEIANAARTKSSDVDAAVDAIVGQHVRLAATSGFLTGLGGFVTLPVALPANVAGFYVLATRMVAAIAAVRGHDINRDEVRTAILLALTGDDATEVLRKAGGGMITGRVTSYALSSLPPAALMAVNKGVAFRIFVQLGRKGLTRFGRAVPLMGGVVGGGVDAYVMRRLAKHAKRELKPVTPPAITSG
jgi:hypothetical protein